MMTMLSNNKLRATLLALLAAASSSPAALGQTAVQYSYAEVISVRPIVSLVCHQRSGRQAELPPRSHTAPILGAIVGAAAGNQIGSGSGRDAATAAGALLGFSMTRDAQERSRYNHHHHHELQPHRSDCFERHSGYDVLIQTSAGTMQTTLPYNPGRSVRIRTEISVVDSMR